MLSAATSALAAFSEKQAVTAHNIANINTDGYKAKTQTLEELPEKQGVRTQDIQEDLSPGPLKQRISSQESEQNYQPRMESVQGSNTRLVNEITSLMQNEQGFAANASVVRVSQDMAGTILNLVA